MTFYPQPWMDGLYFNCTANHTAYTTSSISYDWTDKTASFRVAVEGKGVKIYVKA